eukprot:scaffold11894_cov148-Isochrysis_galbana.AAC.6
MTGAHATVGQLLDGVPGGPQTHDCYCGEDHAPSIAGPPRCGKGGAPAQMVRHEGRLADCAPRDTRETAGRRRRSALGLPLCTRPRLALRREPCGRHTAVVRVAGGVARNGALGAVGRVVCGVAGGRLRCAAGSTLGRRLKLGLRGRQQPLHPRVALVRQHPGRHDGCRNHTEQQERHEHRRTGRRALAELRRVPAA